MPQVLICCPFCGYHKKTAADKIPPNVKSVSCPQCQQSFSLAEAIKPLEEQQPEPQLAAETAAAVDADSAIETDRTNTDVGPEDRVPGERPVPRQVSFDFQGSGKEYFGIWIVNTLLKIVTLGIYSPWAKVRKRRYFYGCTKLEGMNFDYLADPIALLKGWLLGAFLFLLYTLGTNFSPLLSMLIALLVFVLMPWVIVRSRLFNCRNSAHRNIRFNFYPDYKGAYFSYLWLSLLTSLTAGLLAPFMIFKQKQFLVENSSFGKTHFKFFAGARDYYMLSLRGLGVVILVGIGWAVLFGLMGPVLQGLGANAVSAAPLFVMLPILMFFSYLFVALYFYVRMTNLSWNSTRLGRHHFTSELKVLEMLWIFFSNGVAIIASFGLLTPWATVRLTRYRLEHLTVTVDGSLEEFEAANRGEVSAAGEEIGDIFGMDIGL